MKWATTTWIILIKIQPSLFKVKLKESICLSAFTLAKKDIQDCMDYSHNDHHIIKRTSIPNLGCYGTPNMAPLEYRPK